MNSWRQRSTEPKSREIASAIAFGTARPSPPRLAKYSSCRSVELSAALSSRFSRLRTSAGVVAGSSDLELLADGIQAMECVAVVVFVVAFDQARRDPVERPGTAEQGGKVVSHVKAPERGSEFPGRLGALAALLGSAETDIGQRAVVQGGEVLTRPPALTPNGDGGHEGRPHPKPAGPRRGAARRKAFSAKGWVLRDIGFFLLIHLFHGQNSHVLKGCKRKRYRCCKIDM